MKYALLVALREFAENAKTKGFWISILTFPLIIYASITASAFLEKTKPVRNFVLVDQSSELEETVQGALDRLHQRNVMGQLASYVKKHAKVPEGELELDLERTPAFDAKAMAEKWASDNPDTLDQFLKAGGLALALDQLKGVLKEGAPAFEEPKRPFRAVPLPEGISADLAPADGVEPNVMQAHGDPVKNQQYMMLNELFERLASSGGQPK